jgi:hypothetical protein
VKHVRGTIRKDLPWKPPDVGRVRKDRRPVIQFDQRDWRIPRTISLETQTKCQKFVQGSRGSIPSMNVDEDCGLFLWANVVSRVREKFAEFRGNRFARQSLCQSDFCEEPVYHDLFVGR